MISVDTVARKFNLLLATILLISSFATARATTSYSESLPVNGGGTLTYTYEVQTGSCGSGGQQETSAYVWEGFTYTPSGGSGSFLGGDIDYVVPASPCAAGGWDYTSGSEPSTNSNVLTLNYGYCSISFAASVGDPDGSASFSCPPVNTVVLNPAYQVVSILYAPPGNASSTGFTNNSTNGTTTSVGSSFTSGQSMSWGFGFSILGSFGNFSISTTSGSSQGTSNTAAFQESFMNASGLAIQSNKNNPDAINHNYDQFEIWFNPQIQITMEGSIPASYNVGLQPLPNGATAQPDFITVPAIAMESNGASPPMTTVDASVLNQQVYTSDTDGSQTYYPGLASICAGLNVTEYDADACTQADQCGCKPSDFSNILLQDPLIGFANTLSPLEADTAGATACSLPTSGQNCRYIPVPVSKGSATPIGVKLQGAGCSNCDPIPNTFTQNDSTTESDTVAGTDMQTSGVTVATSLFGLTLSHTNTMTWSNTQSTENSTGSGNSMTVTLNTTNYQCDETVSVYEDTAFHTFVFQEPVQAPGTNNGCTQ